MYAKGHMRDNPLSNPLLAINNDAYHYNGVTRAALNA